MLSELCVTGCVSTGTHALSLICSGFRIVDEGIANLPESETRSWDIEGKLVAALNITLATTADLDALPMIESDDYGYLYARLAMLGIDPKYSKEGAVKLLMESLRASVSPHSSTVGLLLRLVEDQMEQRVILELWYAKTNLHDAHLFLSICRTLLHYKAVFTWIPSV